MNAVVIIDQLKYQDRQQLDKLCLKQLWQKTYKAFEALENCTAVCSFFLKIITDPQM